MDNIIPYSVYPCGDHALTIDFGNMVDEAINGHVHMLFNCFKLQNIKGVKDIIPAYSGITLVYNIVEIRRLYPNNTAYNTILKIVENTFAIAQQTAEDAQVTINIPVCYDPDFAPDLHEMADRKNMPPQTIVQLHCSKTYRVFMLGFLPGFAYLGTVPIDLQTPRKSNPRTKVLAGSVGIAGKQTGIYPFESPGGWNIIGQTPLKIFDANRSDGALLKPGQQVQFYPISSHEFKTIKASQ